MLLRFCFTVLGLFFLIYIIHGKFEVKSEFYISPELEHSFHHYYIAAVSL